MGRKNKTSGERQGQIYEFIKDFIAQHGYPPSVREVGKAVGLKSASTVHGYMRKLEERGLLSRAARLPRALGLLGEDLSDETPADTADETADDIVRLPLIGTVAAGVPILAEQNVEDVFSLPRSLVGTGDASFMLRVRGDSMINVGIYEGDFVIVREQETAENGEIIVALVDNESATVKRYFREADCIRLQPENDNMRPFYEKNVRILGKVIGVYRKL